MNKSRKKITVLDFGSQYAHLIAKRLRMSGYYSEIALPSSPLSAFENTAGIILSGGPSSVYEKNIPEFNSEIFSLEIPMLGLCYGHQLMSSASGGKVSKALTGEFGIARLENKGCPQSPLFKDIAFPAQVWMSHQDEVTKTAPDFEVIGFTKDCKFAAVQDLSKKRFGLQFHIEVKDTTDGNKILENFAKICNMEKNWDNDTVLDIILNDIRSAAKDKKVLLFLSGGVDSTVAFALLNKALGQDRVLGLHIDNGFMRLNESEQVAKQYRSFGFNNFIVEDAGKTFLKAVQGLTDPQKKRMAVGETFIAVRNEVVSKQHLNEDEWLLAQGTLYPDIIESGGTENSKTIKTHHNRVAGIQKLIEKGLIIEPLKDLYKDEVRSIGKKIGLSDHLVMRHPFPGPGLSINVLCSDAKFTKKDKEEFEKASEELSSIALDMFCEKCSASMEKYVLPVKSVGVQGDFRTYKFPAALSFEKQEGGYYHIPKNYDKLEKASSLITNNCSYINRCIIRLWQNPAVSDGDLKLQEGYCDKNRLDQLRQADDAVLTELQNTGWYNRIFQHLTISLPYASSKNRTSFVLRPVFSEDVMTARFARLPHEILLSIVKKISELPFTDAIFFDLTNKPPATFGWE
ncbi:glutamine-hydrolyzing GMP synthase [Treponema parvum]|uniref:GMP synthase (glutamine-hydrolyzing) n=1 Tax=Treponema parvum TaxID=138851 RepID=A0A975F567_9SPIR|nr:glutamine-hydrolyzing GMP synthase [Treponema parvum]QTQ14676.1 glutamine-hydrolyzing GMP synthase [Treponema parvum]